MQDGARIHQLRVAAIGRRGVPTVQSVVEDAFRTQLSAMPGPGLLVLRRLDLGPIANRRDQGRINRMVSAHLAGAARGAVRFDAPGAAQAAAVWFPGPLAPHRAVFRAIAQGGPVPICWPFRAVFGRTLLAPASRLLRHILTEVVQQPQAAPSLAVLLADLGPKLVPVVAGLPGDLAEAIVRALTVPVASAPPTRGRVPGTLGAADPAPRAAPQALPLGELRTHARALIREPARLEVIAAAQLAAGVNRPVPLPVVLHRAEALAHALSAVSQGDAGTGAESKAAASQIATDVPQQQPGHQKSSDSAGQAAAPGRAAPQDARDETKPDCPSARSGPGPDPSAAQPATDDTAPPGTAKRAALHPGPAAPPDANSVPDAESSAQYPEVPQPGPLAPGAPTAWAGLASLMVLVDRAYGPWLASDAAMLGAFGQRMLLALTRRLPVPGTDPAAAVLAQLDRAAESADTPLPFHLPQPLAAPLLTGKARLEICSVMGRPGWRMARIPRRRGAPDTVLAVWRGRPPDVLRALLTGLSQPLQKGPAKPFTDAALLQTCALALRLWLRQTARMPLRQLLLRPGHVAATRTHLDVTFDASLIDLTLRRHGLDISPGWCPWLFRVLTIHYDFGESHAR